MPADDERLVNLDEIARLLESNEGPPGAQHKPAGGQSRSGLRVTGAVAAGALVAGSGLGFGIGNSLTAPENAEARLAGTGFLPARGWSVVQSGTIDARGASHAIAANVPLRPGDDPQDIPYATLGSLPARGVVIAATFTTRGDPAADFGYQVRTLPLQISSAARALRGVLLPHPLGEYRLRAGVKGTNVDARIYFGAREPSREALSAAQHQLNRLAVASDRVTIFARPAITDGTAAVDLFGSVDNGKAGETVDIQAKDCGSSFFRAVEGTETRQGGGWSTQYYPGITTTLRAVWNETSSTQTTVRQRARVSLVRRPSGRKLYVAAGGRRSFWRKRVQIQRQQGSRWVTLKTIVLTETSAMGGYYASSGAGAEFTVAVPKGTLLRAVLPRSQAPPCYLPGVSKTVRT
ncbi:MAG: hypothetical protein H0U46_09555 [Actinobacteria bacterium]|nr:hypothetical protein [Actinomycetota bacterium]